MADPTPKLLTEVLSNVLEEAAFFMIEPEPVSYTHLTLPTILRV